jgi:formylglycine-generating enzyme required for sulfatase activity
MTQPTNDNPRLVIRGGSRINDPASGVRPGFRNYSVPAMRYEYLVGFRTALAGRLPR